jgi:ATP-dependent Clp protease ATP-binding subunit ClpA
MFERFTERACQVVVLAQEEARTLKHNYIGTEHILLGLLREEEGLAAQVLESLDVTAERVRAQVARIVGSGEEVTSGQIPFTPRGKKMLELALREALSLGHNYIGTEHVLLGLVRENEGVAARILLDFDADSEKVRNEVLRRLSGPGSTATSTQTSSKAERVQARFDAYVLGLQAQIDAAGGVPADIPLTARIDCLIKQRDGVVNTPAGFDFGRSTKEELGVLQRET